jgi:15-cis-phytoene synthase
MEARVADSACARLQEGEDILAFSRAMIEGGSRSFARAATLMPPNIRDSVYLLYAWCRHCDDCIDDQHLGFPREHPRSARDLDSRIALLRAKTVAAYRGEADEPAFRAFSNVIRIHAIPERFALDLLNGFAMDASGRQYENEEDTLAYCYHVAGAVGLMMAAIMGVKDRSTLLRACDLGIAFQLTNISRDVIADAEMGRIYLPGRWLAEYSLTRETLSDRSNRDRLFAIIERTLDLADLYYYSARHGLAELPFRCAWSIASALRIYRAIGSEIRKAGASAWDERRGTSQRGKLVNVAHAGLDAAKLALVRQTASSPARVGLWTPPSLRTDEVGSRRVVAPLAEIPG